MTLATGLKARWLALVATADRNLLSGLSPSDCDTEGSSRDGSGTCSGAADGNVEGIGIGCGGERVGIGVCGGSRFDGGACFCGGA